MRLFIPCVLFLRPASTVALYDLRMSRALYTINVTEKVPSALGLSAEVMELLQKDFISTASYNFAEELELVSKDAEGPSPRPHSEGALNLNEGAAAVTAVAVTNALGGAIGVNGSGPKAQVAQDASASSSSGSNSSVGSSSRVGVVGSGGNQSSAEPTAVNQQQIKRDKERDEALLKDSQVTAMTLQTGQPRDACIFYLESCNYDVGQAISMLNEFTTRD